MEIRIHITNTSTTKHGTLLRIMPARGQQCIFQYDCKLQAVGIKKSHQNKAIITVTTKTLQNTFSSFSISFLTNMSDRIFMMKLLILLISVLPKGRSFTASAGTMLQFCRGQVFHHKLKNQRCSFMRDWIDAVASRCFPHPTISLASEQTLKDLKRFQGDQRGGEESGFG